MGLFRRKTFETVEEAKEFLIAKVISEASLAGSALNGDQQKALNYSADEPSTGWEIEWDNVNGSDDEGQEFERQMVQFLSNAYERDKHSGSEDKARYKEANDMLGNGDGTNWIVTISHKAIGTKGLFGS